MTAHIRRLIEAQREMTRAVSHELRTPVARLRFGLEMLADCESADERREKLNALDRDIEQLDELIDEILTYARLEEGTPNIEFQPVFLLEVCDQLIGELEDIRGDILIDARGSRDLTVEGDPRYLHRILQNASSTGTAATWPCRRATGAAPASGLSCPENNAASTCLDDKRQ